MVEFLVEFFLNNRLYLFSGGVLAGLAIVPANGKISSKTQKIFYLATILWIICLVYRINTGQDVQYLFSDNGEVTGEAEPAKIGGPFKRYYNNEAGRKAQAGE